MAAAILLAPPVSGQSAADLLQKGIYNQETVGNLDAAIQLYRQVIASGSDARGYAAQAQFRLGVCLTKKGDSAEAMKAFQQLIADYPEQKELVAKAREYMPADLKLLPAPWSEGELLEYELRTSGGAALTTMVLTVEANPARPQNLIFQNRAYTGGQPMQNSRVEVERESMRPVSLSYFNMALGETRIDYEAGQARVQGKGKEPRTLALEGPVFDNESVLFLVRRLPLSAGYKTALPLVSPIGMPVKLEFAVLGTEDIQVPAGKFHCYKFEFRGIPQTYWIAMDAPRQVVRFDVGTVSFELASARRVDPVAPVEYRDQYTGLSLTATPGWIVQAPPESQSGEYTIRMLDPEAKAFAAVWEMVVKCDKAKIVSTLQSQPEDKAKERRKMFKDYTVRPGSIELRQIGGQHALSAIADYTEGTAKKTEYLVWVFTENSRCQFFARTAAAEFDAFRKRFDPIVETVKLK
jgi:hypothetical protein